MHRQARRRPLLSRLVFFVIALSLTTSATAWGYWSATTAVGGSGASSATTVNPGSTPTATAGGQSVVVSWSASTLANGQSVTGYLIKRYDSATITSQPVGAGCSSPVSGTSCIESGVPAGSWHYTVTPLIGTNWRGAESSRSVAVTVVAPDITAPTNDLSLNVASGDASRTGTTVYYRGVASGELRVRNALTDTESGPASSQTSALSGTATGWTHTGSTVSTPSGGPFVSNAFSWTAGTTTSPQVTVTGRDVANNSADTTLTFTNDSTAPSGSTISYTDGTTTASSVSISFTTGTDDGSGIASRRLQRTSATLSSGVCGTFSGFLNLEPTGPTSPYKDSNISAGTCYKYQYVVIDKLGNKETTTSANVVKVDYAGAIAGTPGLISFWRLGEPTSSVVASDSMTGLNGALLTSRPGEVGTTWTYRAGNGDVETISENRAYRNGTGSALYEASGTPASADYSVKADIYVKSNLAGDSIGVVGRLDSAGTTFYVARWQEASATWNLSKSVSGTFTSIASSPTQPALTVGQTYRIRLEMVGTSLKLHVNGVVMVSATDTSITAAGKAGIRDGVGGGTAIKSATLGLHYDNFAVIPRTYPRAADSKGTNTGEYENGPTLGAAGALAGDANTAARFDGVNDYVQMTGTTGLPTGAGLRSVETWFKTSNSSATRQVLFTYGSTSDTQEFGLWLNQNGASLTAWGFGEANGHNKVFTLPARVDDGAWHHVVNTYDGTSLTIYIDGVALPSQTATRNTVIDSYGFSIGAVLNSGTGAFGNYFDGTIDEMALYNTVLDAATVTDHYELGKKVADTTGPTGGSVDATGLVGTGSRYSTSTTLSLSLAKGTDPSGLAPTGSELRRATASLTTDTCGTYGASSLISGGTDPASPMSDTVADQACYRYEYVVPDAYGNTTTYTSPNIKVDTTAPAAPSLTFSAFTNSYWAGTGSTVYYRSAVTGSFLATASTTDSGSGIAAYTFPGLGTGWTGTVGAQGVTYTWSASPVAPGTRNVTARNGAGLVSAGAPFTPTPDDTAPTAGTVTYADGNTTSTTVSVGFTTGTDSGSGLDTRVLQRDSAPLTDTTCGAFSGTFTTIAGGSNPASSPVDNTVTAGNCYKYQYVVTDKVGNKHTATSASVVKVIVVGTGGPGTNLALSRPVTVTSTESTSFPGTNAVDGNATTRWSSAPSDPQSITVDLGSLQNIARVRLQWEAAYATAYTIQTSTDGTNFTNVRSITGGDGGIDDNTALGGMGRYVRVLGTTRATIYGYSLFELEVYGSLNYTSTVNATFGLTDYYRLGETTVSSDTFTGTAGATLQSRSGELGAAWTSSGSTADAVLTAGGRLRKSGTATVGSRYYSSGVPVSADYSVEADVYVASSLANDMIALNGRMDQATNPSYYHVRYDRDAGQFQLFRINSGTYTFLGSYAQTFAAGATFRMSLDMNGSTIRVLVDGVQRMSVVDGSITAAGRGGVVLGFHPQYATTVTDTTGMHLDNFTVTPQLRDSKGTIHGDYLYGPTLGVAGALTADTNTAAQFDGFNDYATFTRAVSDDFSIEFLFKSTQGIGTGTQWWQGAGLVDGDVSGAANDFGVSLRSDGRIVAGVGNPDTSIVSTNGSYNNNAWHHVVFTRTKASGALALYVDGVAAGTATGNTLSLTGPTNLNIGRGQTGSNYYAGTLDEVAIYNVTMSATVVNEHNAAR